MARYRLSEPAKADIRHILMSSERRWGAEARVRYRALPAAALHRIAADPTGPLTVDRGELLPGLRRFHIRHGRDDSREAPVGDPVHVLFYRAVQPGLLEIVRVLHERAEPSRHFGAEREE